MQKIESLIKNDIMKVGTHLTCSKILRMSLPSEIQAEFDRAAQARIRGNEGRARVCARRAAGIAARRYLTRRGLTPRTSSAYDLLKIVADDAALSDAIRQPASHLILRVDEEFKLPLGIDLVEEARSLCEALLSLPV